MGSQSVSKSDKIEKIKATSETQADNSNNIIKLDEERDTKLFDNTNEEENLKKQPKKTINEQSVEEALVLTEEVKNDEKVKLGKEKVMSPAVRKIVNENNLNIDEIKGSGKDGMILKGDLLNLMGIKPAPSDRKIKFGEEEKIKMSRLRMTIACLLYTSPSPRDT